MCLLGGKAKKGQKRPKKRPKIGLFRPQRPKIGRKLKIYAFLKSARREDSGDTHIWYVSRKKVLTFKGHKGQIWPCHKSVEPMQYGYRWNPLVELISKMSKFFIFGQFSTSEAEKRPNFRPFWPLLVTRTYPPVILPEFWKFNSFAISWW